jgi:hypothetical protein
LFSGDTDAAIFSADARVSSGGGSAFSGFWKARTVVLPMILSVAAGFAT